VVTNHKGDAEGDVWGKEGGMFTRREKKKKMCGKGKKKAGHGAFKTKAMKQDWG